MRWGAHATMWASGGACLVRCSGTDPALVELAKKNALALGAWRKNVLPQIVYNL